MQKMQLAVAENQGNASSAPVRRPSESPGECCAASCGHRGVSRRVRGLPRYACPSSRRSGGAFERSLSCSHIREWPSRHNGCCSTSWFLRNHKSSVAATPRFTRSYADCRGGKNCRTNPQASALSPRRCWFYEPGPAAATAVPIPCRDGCRRWVWRSPSAGWDLASLNLRAVLDGDHFVVKRAEGVDIGITLMCLLTFLRTDQDVPKHKGIVH